MSSTQLLQPLEQLLTQAESLLNLAQGNDWVGLAAEMVNYQQKITLLEDQAYLQSLKDAGLALDAQGLILQIHGVNQKVDEIAHESHEKIASELRQMIQSDKAMDAYGR